MLVEVCKCVSQGVLSLLGFPSFELLLLAATSALMMGRMQHAMYGNIDTWHRVDAQSLYHQ